VELRELELVSQRWQGERWVHRLLIIKPGEVTRPKQAVLIVAGGSWRGEEEPLIGEGKMPKEARLFLPAAEQLGSVIAVVTRVPFQPMFDGRKEDDLIAFTMDRYLETGDDGWPLLLPMVKSAVSAMDATQAYAAEQWDIRIEHFTVTGASKRGWTTWLTAAVDERVNAIAPIVIDVLNMQAQMAHQADTWGEPSLMIRPYTELNIIDRFDSPRGQSLLSIVDPYAYRERLRAVRKTILLGTNDPYWPVDAANMYWDGLAGAKSLLYAPNSGHDMGRGLLQVVGGLIATHRAAADGSALPEPAWRITPNDGACVFDVTSASPPSAASLWWADSASRDFRQAVWQTRPITSADERVTTDVPRPVSGYRAAYVALTYPDMPAGLQFCTQIAVIAKDRASDPVPAAPEAMGNGGGQ
jgi:PhoPQ-activated pathogenicity-related protein